MNVGEKFERWRIQRNSLEVTLDQAFFAGHAEGAEHRHDEVHKLRDALEAVLPKVDRGTQRFILAALRPDGPTEKKS